jgi:deazaflavin-dependent oxidoreductase (nitroreductase family)
MKILRWIFWLLNKFFMVPLFRLGLGPFIGNPITGYIMVVKTIGRKTGEQRCTPVNYAIMNGNVYCAAGFGRVSDWYRNLKANPNVELILPSGPIAGVAEEVSDPEEELNIIRKIFINSGFVAFLFGFNTFKLSDEKINKVLGWAPILRIRPVGVGSGASDPQGWMWVTMTALTLLALYLFLWR